MILLLLLGIQVDRYCTSIYSWLIKDIEQGELGLLAQATILLPLRGVLHTQEDILETSQEG